MPQKFDLIVIGTGSAAAAAAGRCREAGWSVAVADERPYGGTCALRGCMPKKVLVGAAEAVSRARELEGKGVDLDGLSIHWSGLMDFKRTFTEPVPEGVWEGYRDKGIATFLGHARFTGARTVEVGGETLEGRHVLIATGAEPAELKIGGEAHLATSDDFLELDVLPERIVLVGGGYIAFEFAHVAARAGAKVTILHRGARPLKGFDPDLVAQLVEKTRRLGVEVHLRTEATGVERRGGALRVQARLGRQRIFFEADLAVHAAGRAPRIAGLGLDAAGVESGRGVKVNEFLQSVSNPAVYAAGDAAESGPPLTPVAAYEGRTAAANLLEGNHARPDYGGVPSVVFTVPPLAAAGLGEAEARARGKRFRVSAGDASGWFTSRRLGGDCAGYKILIEEGSEKILGAHLLGPGAEEAINLFALAIRQGLGAGALREQIWAYPTASSDLAYML